MERHSNTRSSVSTNPRLGRLRNSTPRTGVLGVDAYLVEVEVDLLRASGDQVRFNVVGLPDAAVQESRERVRSAIKNSGFSFPMGRLTVNLAPADVRKEGPSFDLPIALGILAAHGSVKPDRPDEIVFAGELGLDGEVRAISGVLPMAIGARAAGKRAIAVLEPNVAEAAVVRGLEVYGLRTLSEAAGLLSGDGALQPASDATSELDLATAEYSVDFGDVKGQQH